MTSDRTYLKVLDRFGGGEGASRSRRDSRHDRRRLAAVTVSVLGLAAAAVALRARRRRGMLHLSSSTTIRRPINEVYEFWRRLENLPTFMIHLDEVRATGDGTSHWVATAPFGRRVQWDARTVTDLPGQEIAWRAVGRPDVPNAGRVRFSRAPDAVSTEVRVDIAYRVPAGALGRALAAFFGEEPHQQVADDLRRLKQVLETGEVLRSDGAPSGGRSGPGRQYPQRAAAPAAAREQVPA